MEEIILNESEQDALNQTWQGIIAEHEPKHAESNRSQLMNKDRIKPSPFEDR